MTEIAEIKRASLLGIPIELRLQIYSYVLRFDTGRLVIYDSNLDSGHEWRFKYERIWTPEDGFGTRIVRHDATLPRVSWVSLKQTCKAVRGELESHMHSPSAFQDEHNHTYEMAITGWGGKLEGIVWQSIPCTPEQCRVLTANITLIGAVKFWGDGGPMPIVRELYQTLNRFLHCGPMLGSTRPLERHIRLKKLVVTVSRSTDPLDPDQQDLLSGALSVSGFARELETTGLLNGYIDQIVVHEAERNHGEPFAIEVRKHEEPAAVPAAWDRYGFEWGALGSRSERS